MKTELLTQFKKEDNEYNAIHTSLLYHTDDVKLIKDIYELRIEQLERRIKEYEKNIQS